MTAVCLVTLFISRSSAVCPWVEQQHSLIVWRSGEPSLTTSYGPFSRCSKNTPSKFLEQSHQSNNGIGKIGFWRHSRLLRIPGIQKGIQIASKRRWKNVYSMRVNAEC